MPATALVAALSLVAGFASAEVTGVRALGGVAPVLALLWCAKQWCHRGGLDRVLSLGGLYLGALVGSHLLAKAVGAWPAVLVTSAVVAAVVTAADRPVPAPA